MKLVVMGVSGTGKTTIGERLAQALQLPFLEGDSLHPKENIAKMSAGIPLQDEDRWPWLDLIGAQLAAAENGLVVTCSALKRSYRDRLRAASGEALAFIFLDGTFALLETRLGQRKGHFMPASMLQSQFDTLQSPVGEPLVHREDVDQSVDAIIAGSLAWLKQLPQNPG